MHVPLEFIPQSAALLSCPSRCGRVYPSIY
jgi:hypothetical protein